MSFPPPPSFAGGAPPPPWGAGVTPVNDANPVSMVPGQGAGGATQGGMPPAWMTYGGGGLQAPPGGGTPAGGGGGGGMLAGMMASSTGATTTIITTTTTASGFPGDVASNYPAAAAAAPGWMSVGGPPPSNHHSGTSGTTLSPSGSQPHSKSNSKPSSPVAAGAPPLPRNTQNNNNSESLGVPSNVPVYPFGAAPPFAIPANPPPTWGVPSAPSQIGGSTAPLAIILAGAHHANPTTTTTTTTASSTPAGSAVVSQSVTPGQQAFTTASSMPPPFGMSPSGSSVGGSSLPFGGVGGGPGTPFGGGGGVAFSGAGPPTFGGAPFGGPAFVSSTGVSSTVFDFFAQPTTKKDDRNNMKDREDDFVTLSSDPDCEDRPPKSHSSASSMASPTSVGTRLRTSERLHGRTNKDGMPTASPSSNHTGGTTSSSNRIVTGETYDPRATSANRKGNPAAGKSADSSKQRSSSKGASEDEEQRLQDAMHAASTFEVKPGALLDFLFLGNVKDAEDVDFLSAFHITDIINVGSTTYPSPVIKVPNPNGDGTFTTKTVTVHHFQAEDKADFPIFTVFEDCFREIDRIRSQYWKARGHRREVRGVCTTQHSTGVTNTGGGAAGVTNSVSPERTRESVVTVTSDGTTPEKEDGEGSTVHHSATTPSGIVGGANPGGSNIRTQPPAVLLHCEKGISRSATVSIAYLVKRNGWTVPDAHHYVQQRRRIIEPNVGFMEALRKYEQALGQSTTNQSLSEDAERGYGIVGSGLTAGDADGIKIIQRKRRALVCSVRNVRPEVTEDEFISFFEDTVGTVWTAAAREITLQGKSTNSGGGGGGGGSAVSSLNSTTTGGGAEKIWMLAFTMLESCREAAKQNRALWESGKQHPLTAPGVKLEIQAARIHTAREGGSAPPPGSPDAAVPPPFNGAAAAAAATTIGGVPPTRRATTSARATTMLGAASAPISTVSLAVGGEVKMEGEQHGEVQT